MTSEWATYQRMVLQELSRHSSALDSVAQKLQDLAVNTARALDPHREIIDLREKLASQEKESREKIEAVKDVLLSEISDLKTALAAEKVSNASQFSALNVKAGMWGGLIGTAAGLLTTVATKLLKAG